MRGGCSERAAWWSGMLGEPADGRGRLQRSAQNTPRFFKCEVAHSSLKSLRENMKLGRVQFGPHVAFPARVNPCTTSRSVGRTPQAFGEKTHAYHHSQGLHADRAP